jgi:ADP-Ribosyltransferase in polyvalent proteins
MTSDLAKLMEKIDLLQSEELPEPIIEIEKPTMHPLLQAMQELHEEEEHEIEQEVEEEIAYHGTTDDIAEFYPLSHFGTEKAAKDRMEYKKIKDGKIYKVDLNIKNPLTIKDFPGIHYDRLYAFELRDKKLISQKEMEAITTIDDKAELRKALLTKLKELGIDGFVYKNKYEDKGNISYVIVDPSQVKVLSVEPAAEEVTEASPNTLEGSFTPDLVESKTWLAEMLAKGLKGKNAGTIYVLGSWYGNMGIFLQQAGVQFDKLVLVEPDEEALMRSKDLLQQIGDEGKLILIHQKAEDVVYEKPGVVINTSCNETGPVFLTKLPDNMLCLLQARNNNENTLFPTEDEEEFVDYFPLETVYYTGKKQLEDPEVNYVRYMKIGRTGKALDEAITTGQGGGSAGVGGGQMVGGPTTYEQEYDMFKSKGPRRIMAMTEALNDGGFTTFYLTQNDVKLPTSTKVKAKAGEALDAVFED